jgi:hypothetical protein
MVAAAYDAEFFCSAGVSCSPLFRLTCCPLKAGRAILSPRRLTGMFLCFSFSLCSCSFSFCPRADGCPRVLLLGAGFSCLVVWLFLLLVVALLGSSCLLLCSCCCCLASGLLFVRSSVVLLCAVPAVDPVRWCYATLASRFSSAASPLALAELPAAVLRVRCRSCSRPSSLVLLPFACFWVLFRRCPLCSSAEGIFSRAVPPRPKNRGAIFWASWQKLTDYSRSSRLVLVIAVRHQIPSIFLG